MTLHVEIDAQQVNPQPNPTPVTPTYPNQASTAPSVPSSVLDNPGVNPAGPTSSPNVAPSTQDPALIITTANARTTYQWPDGSWRQYPVDLTTENLAYGTGPLYKNAGGFGGPVNNPGTYPPSPFNPPVGQH